VEKIICEKKKKAVGWWEKKWEKWEKI